MGGRDLNLSVHSLLSENLAIAVADAKGRASPCLPFLSKTGNGREEGWSQSPQPKSGQSLLQKHS